MNFVRQGFHLCGQQLLLLLAVLCLGSAGLIPAAEMTNAPARYYPQLWQFEDGLPQDSVQALVQTSDGYLWAGTGRGLARFDGVHFKVFDSQNTPEIKNSFISALIQSKDGSLWIGTAGGLTQLKDGKFYFHELSGGVRANDVKTIFESQDGSLWLGTREGLFHQQDGQWNRFMYANGLVDSVVRTLAETDGKLWIGTASGLNMWQDGKFTVSPGFGVRSIRTIFKDTDGTLWMGLGQGLGHLDHEGKLKIYDRKDGLPDNNVTAIYRDRRGSFWVGSYNGLSRFEAGRFTQERDIRGGDFDQVNTIMEDLEGDIWIGTRNGLHELRIKRFTTYTRLQGLANDNIMSVLEDRHGAMWLGTWGGGVGRLDGRGIYNYNWKSGPTNGLTSDLTLSLYEDRDGSLLVGTDHEGGNFRYDGKLFKRIWSTNDALLYPVVRLIHRDRNDDLWFGTRSGMQLWKDNTVQKFLTNRVPRCLLEDRAGTFWVGTSDGLFYRKDGQFVEWTGQDGGLRDVVVSLYEDQDKNLWIGTMNSGLNRLKDGRLTAYTVQQGMFSDDIFEILEDDHGWLWMGCSRGIYRVSKSNLNDLDRGRTKTINSIAYGKRDGMETVQCSAVGQPGAWKSHDGRLWFATAKGVAVTDPNLGLESNWQPPPVRIEAVVSGKERYESLIGHDLSRRDRAEALRLSPGHSDLEFHYTALSFQAPEKMIFKFKLEGVDTGWREVTRRVAFYNNLRPGKYRFRVKACNNAGVWSEGDSSVAVLLAPQLWQTWWFMGSVGVLAVAFAGGTVRYTTRRNMEQELRRLEKQHAIEAERIRIARDMHDEIGAKLTKISFLGASAKRKIALPHEAGDQIDRMSQTARDVIRALDEIVWAVNPANDTLEHLATYLCRNATEFFENSPVVCQFKIPDELPPCRLGTDVRHNLLLAAKEAMNNVLKHAGATNVVVEISFQAEKLEVIIADNGCGFCRDAPGEPAVARSQRVGSGLTNMRERLSVIGGHCSVTSQPGQGTRIVFAVDLKGKN